MKVYVSGASCDLTRVTHWMNRLRMEGIRISYDWTEAVLGTASDPRTLQSLADLEILGIREADYFWFLTPPEGRGANAWVELGIALMTPSLPICVSGYRTTLFQHAHELSGDFQAHYADDEDAFDRIVSHYKFLEPSR